MPDSALAELDALPQVASAHQDRPAWAADYLSTRVDQCRRRPAVAMASPARGIGVAVIDSGITSWHDDLTPARSARRYPYADQRVAEVRRLRQRRSHALRRPRARLARRRHHPRQRLRLARRQAGMAPDASLVSLKVLDAEGKGTISTIIAALDWVAANASAYNIRVVNLSVGAAVTRVLLDRSADAGGQARSSNRASSSSPRPATSAQNADGRTQYGGILAPGNAPWVLTVGASSTEGNITRRRTTWSPASVRWADARRLPGQAGSRRAGRGILSLAVPGSTLYPANAQYLVDGNVSTGYHAVSEPERHQHGGAVRCPARSR